MTKKHEELIDGILGNLDAADGAREERAGTRFLKRTNTIGERLGGDLEEKTLRWVDPAECRMWERHNRDYALLTEDNCRDLIDGIRAQGRQEFPAVVRKHAEGGYEVICGARRHFAVSWLRANNYPQFKYLVELRDLTDEEAFRLADIENRDREDISDYERAIDYAAAIKLYYGGKQKAMATRLEVSEAWLSRYLQLAKLPDEIVAAFGSRRELRELHARTLKPLMAEPAMLGNMLAEARAIAAERAGQGARIEAGQVMARLKAAAAPAARAGGETRVYRRAREESGLTVRRRGGTTTLAFSSRLSRDALVTAFQHFVEDQYGEKLPIGKKLK